MCSGGGGSGSHLVRGGSTTLRGDEAVVLCVDSWIRFRVPSRIERLLLDVRTHLSSPLQRQTVKPELELSSAGKSLLNAVNATPAAPPPTLLTARL